MVVTGEAAAGARIRGLGRRALQGGMKSVAAGVDAFSRRGPGVVVLAYHRVGADSAAFEIDLPTDRFAAQMAEISNRVTTLDDALQTLASTPEPNEYDDAEPRVVVTFDDGTVDLVEHALPVLVQYQIPVVCYVATEPVDKGRLFPHSGRPLTWQAMREAASTGLVTIGSHTHTHALLDRCAPDVVRDELDRSIELIAEHVGFAPRHFAYPKAVLGSPAARALIAERFDSAAVAGTRLNRPGRTDPQRLARSPIQRSDGMRWFRHKVRGRMALEDDMRRAANRWRYAGATS